MSEGQGRGRGRGGRKIGGGRGVVGSPNSKATGGSNVSNSGVNTTTGNSTGTSHFGIGGTNGPGTGTSNRGRNRGSGGQGGIKNEGSVGNKSSSSHNPPLSGRGENDTKGRGKNASRRKNENSNKITILSDEERRKQDEAKKAAEDAAAAEAERKRAEAQQRLLEQARAVKLLERKALCDRVQASIEALDSINDSVRIHKTHRLALSHDNLLQFRQQFEASKKTLKADLKKCTAFVKKIKSGTAWSMKPTDMDRDIATINLTRYVEEVAAALLEAKLKPTDLPTVLSLCYSMHTRYADFLPSLLPPLWNGIQSGTDSKLRRVHVRLLTEFLLHGIVVDTKQYLKFMADITGAAKGYAVTDANLVIAVVKAGSFELLSSYPRSIRNHIALLKDQIQSFERYTSDVEHANRECNNFVVDDIPVIITSDLVSKANVILAGIEETLKERAVSNTVYDALRFHAIGAFDSLAKSWIETGSKLQKLEKRCEQDRLLQGQLSEVREKGLTDARKLKENLLRAVETLSDVLDKPMPILETEEEEERHKGGPGLELWTKAEGEDSSDFGPFDDEETRSFYCDIPDLLTLIPPALLGMTADDVAKLQVENLRKHGPESVSEDNTIATEIDMISEANLFDEEEGEIKAPELLNEDQGTKDTPHYRLQVLLEQELPECTRREEVDALAEKFCVNHGRSKTSRKRLTKALFQVPHTRLDLLPHYSRLAAAMDRIYPDMSSSLIVELEQQFHGLAKFKKQINPETRLKNARYIGELTKFRVAPPIVVFRCLRRCLDDFSGFNIDVACCILESCGRYLYRTQHTASGLNTLMDTMMRLSKTKNLDERYQSLISSAFFMVKPPLTAPRKVAKVYPPLEAYLRHLILVKLEPTEASISFVAKQILKFPWSDSTKQCGPLVCKYMLKACRKGRYRAVSAVAAVAASVRRNKPEIAARLIDACIEEIQWAIEHPSFRDQQRTLAYARLLGELHACSLISGSVLIQELYNFINFDHSISQELRDASAKLLANTSEEIEDTLPVYNSASGVTIAINENEEMEDDILEIKHEVPKVVAVSPHSLYDPRVLSQIDLPNSFFRIKLVCSLLESSAKQLVTRNNLNNLEGFLTAFQRYLFTKATLPTDVEFSILDTFDAVDSEWRKATMKDKKKPDSSVENQGFPRYENWIDAHNATIEKEEQQALSDIRSRRRLEALAGISDGNFDILNDDSSTLLDAEGEDDDYDGSDVDDTESDDEMDEEGEDVSTAAAGHTDDDTDTKDYDMEDEEVSDVESEEEGEEEDYDDEEEFDEEAHMRQLEEEAFERELRRITMEALEKGKNTARAGALGKVAANMPSGSQFIRKKNIDVPEEDGPAVTLGGEEGISFQLLKKGSKGKVEAKKLIVPKDTNIAIRAAMHDDAADREHDIIKARVLQYEAESATQEASGGNVYLEQTKLQVIRNRPVLSMEVIDRNFGTSRGERQISLETRTSQLNTARGLMNSGRGTGRGRGRGGRTLKNF
jgi:regulator of nonsense transcripts 2